MPMEATEIRLDLPHLRTPLPGPVAQEIIRRDCEVMSPSYTRCYPLVVKHGEGALIEDVDGNRFLDFNAGIAVVAAGHCHPHVVDAIQRQAARLIHMSGTDFYYESMVELAEKLASLAPGGGPRRVYFGNSGTEAVEAALKLARYHTGRHQFIAFLGGFHGRTMGALSLTGSKSVQKKGFGPLLTGVHHIPYANCYRCAYGKQVETCAVECVKVIEETLIRHILPAEEIAGIVVEPIQGEGGYLVPPQKFFDELQAVAHRHGILLIFDEVQSGMGRTGKMFAAEHFDASPDMMTLAKGIASGMPVSALVTRGEVMNWKPGAHASTFGGNPVAVAAALATIELLEEDLMENANRTGTHIMNRIRNWPKRFPMIGNVRGLGLMIGIEFVRDQCTKERAPELRDRVEMLAFERGLLVLGCGPNSLRLCPPLMISMDQADFAVDTLEECFQRADALKPRTLDVGCGINKYPGALGIDRIPASRADVLCELDHFPYPFRDGSFERVRAVHVIEHVADVIRTMEEFHRLLRPGGCVYIATPHYTDFSSFCDPTHRWHLNSYSLRYFGNDHAGYGYYSKARFRELSVRVKLLALWRYLGFEFLVNTVPRFRKFWEHYLCFVVRGKVIEWELQALAPP